MASITILPSQVPGGLAPGFVRVFGDLRFRTDGDLLALEFAADGTLWSVEDPGLLRQWSETGQQLFSSSLSDLETMWAFSSDARLLASASDDLALWDVVSGRLLTAVSQPSWVTALAFRPDRRVVATGHDDGILRLWEVAQRKGSDPLNSGGLTPFFQLLCELDGHEGAISALAFDPEGKRLASASEDKVIYLWDVETSKLLGLLAGHTDRIQALVWHPQGNRLISAGWDSTARVWDATTLEPVLIFNGHATQVTAMAITAEGRLLACADSQNAVLVWDFNTHRLCHRLEGHLGPITALACAPDARRLASGGSDRMIHVWDLHDGQPSIPKSAVSAPAQIGGRHQGIGLAVNQDGTRLANTFGSIMQVWDTATAQLVTQTEDHVRFLSVAYSPDGRWIAGGAADALIRLWTTERGEPAGTLEEDDQTEPVTALAFSADSKMIASASANGLSAWLWEVESGEPRLIIPDALDGCTIEALAFHPEGRLLAVGGIDWLATGGSDGAVSLWDWQERCEVATFDGGVTCLAFHPSGRWLATATLARSVCIWDVETHQLFEEFLGHDDTITCLAYSPNGRWLATGRDDNTVRLWEASTGRLLASTDLNTQIKALTFSPDNSFLFTGNGNLTCYQLEVQRLLAGSGK